MSAVNKSEYFLNSDSSEDANPKLIPNLSRIESTSSNGPTLNCGASDAISLRACVILLKWSSIGFPEINLL